MFTAIPGTHIVAGLRRRGIVAMIRGVGRDTSHLDRYLARE